MALRDGRLQEDLLEQVRKFTSSLEQDKVLAYFDVRQSMAHARALHRSGIITEAEAEELVSKLQEILMNINANPAYFEDKFDDIHMAIESKLGEIGKKLHAGRSRNDQVACDMRMYCRDSISNIIESLRLIVSTLKKLDIENNGQDIVMPVYTHLQRAQSISLSVYLDSYASIFKRDIDRFTQLYIRVNQMPLGSAASASTSIELDREELAAELDFDSVIKNPIDAVSARDYILEFANDISILGVNLSRLSEDFVLYSSKEFSFIDLSDSITETSSIMPQKKNPDCFELIRGASSKLTGIAMSLTMLMKGLPLSYNRDMQNDKQIFTASKTINTILELLPLLLARITFNKEKMEEATRSGFSDAADFAEYLVLKKNIDFRVAHEKTAILVRKGIEQNKKNIAEISLADIQNIVSQVTEDMYDFIDIKASVDRRLQYFYSERSKD